MRHSSARDAPTAELEHALGRPGCAICHLTHRAVGRYLKSIAYEQVNDVDLRAELRAARGFCGPHAHRWVSMSGNVLGTALIYRDAITAALRELEAGPAARGMLPTLLGSRPRATAVCVACRFEADASERYLGALLEGITELAPAVAASDGLCFPHMRRAVDSDARRAEPLVVRAQQVGAQLVSELDEVIRKEDYRFKDEPRTDAERTAPRRAVTWAAGLAGTDSGSG